MKIHVHPRFSETDALGHISGSTLPVWFQEGREPILELFSRGNLKRHAAVIRRQEIDYLGEVLYGTDVEIESFVSRIGNSSVQIRQQLFQSGKCKAENLATLICFDAIERKATPIPDEIRTQLQRLQQE